MKKSAYPKSNGQPWDPIRRKKFDRLRKLFRWTIAEAAKNKNLKLPADLLDVTAWNCAFHVVTES